MVYDATGWPTYSMLQAEVPGVARWAEALLTIALCISIMAAIAAMIEPGGDQLHAAGRASRGSGPAGQVGAASQAPR